jgi:hypothetical protein
LQGETKEMTKAVMSITYFRQHGGALALRRLKANTLIAGKQFKQGSTTAAFSTLPLEPELSIPSTATEGYRRLLKAQRKLFAGDTFALSQGRQEIRSQFIQNGTVTDNATLETLLKGIAEAEDMLLHGIMQGKLNEQSGNFGKGSL